MSGCGVCCYTDYEVAEVFEQYYPKARKEHKCCECGGLIAVGTTYERIDMVYDGSAHTYKTCPVCAEIAKAFQCDARIPGELWEGMYEVMGSITTGCFDRLSTPEAKAELERRWMEWKGFK